MSSLDFFPLNACPVPNYRGMPCDLKNMRRYRNRGLRTIRSPRPEKTCFAYLDEFFERVSQPVRKRVK